MTHLEFRGILALIGSCLCDFLVLSLPLDSTTNRLFFVIDALLELNDSILSITLLFLDILHQIVKYAF